MGRAWEWALAAVVVAGSIALWLFLRARGKKPEANRAMADVIDAWSAPRIAAKQAEVTKLKKQLGDEHALVDIAQGEVTKERVALAAKYQALELTPEEMEARFKDLRV